MGWFNRRKRDREEPEFIREVLVRDPRMDLLDDDGSMTDRWNVAMTLPLRSLAALYLAHDWPLARPDSGMYPNHIALGHFISELVDRIADTNFHYTTNSRLLALQDEEFPGTIDIYLHVGTADRPLQEATR